ncbi:glycerol-3-phosphate dehydrogenase [Halosimplex carlsbadense 2-9-1]|uniref:Glycerol-3-phosphate dehydrogenase n=1 Tax=Halosimplex carlsbadense 2-9-1 TaxID=797114 RepID=M0CQG5_9EURY|nr:FAD-dependent oxidoreductase [Halosimplex carlsbadense]ELZ24878.1 glycerol-3-phosphate dehydrogenase [Halosimplex carlsbadense 2-9-1]
MAIDTTVLVIGGGATGAGVARDLALRGCDVTLVDRGGLQEGTTARSHGLLHSGARYAEADEAGAEECIAENRTLRNIAGAAIADTGGLFVQLAEDDPDYFDAKRDACERIGIPVEVLDGDEARAAVPDLAAGVERAMHVPDAVVSPSRLVAANARDAADHGAAVHYDSPVEGIRVADGEVAGVAVGGALDETISPEVVVNATGAWAGDLAAMAGVSVEMRPTRGLMVSVEHARLGTVLNRCREPGDGDIVVPHEREAVLGTTSVAVEDPDKYERADWERERVREECAAMCPPLADAARVREWWGVRPLYEPDEADRGGRGISRGFFLLDHADEGVGNFLSVVGGKLTTYRLMAEATADAVCERLGVDEPCSTAAEPLPGADDPDTLDGFVADIGGPGPSDSDTAGR